MFSPQILRFETLPSTNLEAARLAAEGASEGLCVVAHEQTEGRGRLNRHWVSPRGAGLYFSTILRPQFGQNEWPLLTLMAAVAVHDTLVEVFALVPDIKWPNDILINNKKLCGILAETVETPMGRAVVLGIGINLKRSSMPAELQDVATSVAAETGLSIDATVVVEALVRLLASYYEMLKLTNGPEIIVREWSSRSTYAVGKRLQVVNGEEIIAGISRGIERDGALILETEAGEFKTIRTGDVTSLRLSGTEGSEVHAQREQ